MARDNKLREVLDSLSGDPARSLPAQDRELMESVLRRLKIQENRRLAEQEDGPGPTPEELEHQELEALRQRQAHDSQEMMRLQEERERLLAHQQELEDRLARLEAASHGGTLSYIEEENDETVEFSRVDLPQEEEEMLEFNYLGSQAGQLEPPTEDVWDREPGQAEEPQWEDWPDHDQTPETGETENWPETPQQEPWQSPQANGGTDIAWDDESTPWPDEETEPAAQWDEPQQTAESTEWDTVDPAETPEAATEDAPPWSESDQETPWPDQGDDAQEWDTSDSPESADPQSDVLEGLDDRTRAELAELENQLAELEQEIEKRSSGESSDESETA
jgi:hypothetical protein